jgi:hypothetical protein
MRARTASRVETGNRTRAGEDDLLRLEAGARTLGLGFLGRCESMIEDGVEQACMSEEKST